MKIEFSKFLPITTDKNHPPNQMSLVNFRYKTVHVGEGEPPKTKEVIDWDATGKASALIYNIGKGE